MALYAAQIGSQADYYGQVQSSDDEVMLHEKLLCSDVCVWPLILDCLERHQDRRADTLFVLVLKSYNCAGCEHSDE